MSEELDYRILSALREEPDLSLSNLSDMLKTPLPKILERVLEIARSDHEEDLPAPFRMVKLFDVHIHAESRNPTLWDLSSFLWDLNTLYEMLFLIGENADPTYVKSAWFPWMRRSIRTAAKINVTNLRTGTLDSLFAIAAPQIVASAVAIYKSPQIIREVTHSLVIARKEIRDSNVDHELKEADLRIKKRDIQLKELEIQIREAQFVQLKLALEKSGSRMSPSQAAEELRRVVDRIDENKAIKVLTVDVSESKQPEDAAEYKTQLDLETENIALRSRIEELEKKLNPS